MFWNNGVILFAIAYLHLVDISQAINQDEARTELIRLRCSEACSDRERRECLNTPDTCGGCIPDHVDIYGVCTPDSMDAAEDFPRMRKDFHEQLERKKKALNQVVQLGPPSNRFPETEIQRDIDKSPGSSNTPDPHGQPQGHPSAAAYSSHDEVEKAVIIGVIAALAAVALVGIIVAIVFCCRFHQSVKDTSDADYVSYGSTQQYNDAYPTKPPSADRKLADSAQMFHYQHVKQQLLELEKAQEVAAQSESGCSSGDETEDGKFTVYECPGLADTGDMEVRNPLYSESPTLPITNGSGAPDPTHNGPRTDATFNGHRNP